MRSLRVEIKNITALHSASRKRWLKQYPQVLLPRLKKQDLRLRVYHILSFFLNPLNLISPFLVYLGHDKNYKAVSWHDRLHSWGEGNPSKGELTLKRESWSSWLMHRTNHPYENCAVFHEYYIKDCYKKNALPKKWWNSCGPCINICLSPTTRLPIYVCHYYPRTTVEP